MKRQQRENGETKGKGRGTEVSQDTGVESWTHTEGDKGKQQTVNQMKTDQEN